MHVIILGLDPAEHAPPDRPLYTYPDINDEPLVGTCKIITPYLVDGSRLQNPRRVVKKAGRPINGLPRLKIGSKPIDGGHYIFNSEQRDLFLDQEPGAKPYLKPYIGALEYLQGGERWILALQDARPSDLRGLPLVRDRIAAVRDERLASKSKPTLQLAETPTLWHVNVIPQAPFLVVPKVSSERRHYVPCGWIEPPFIPSDLLFVLIDATLADFAIISSAMHMAWMRTVAGRLESRYRYSDGVVYNTFPLPPGFGALRVCAWSRPVRVRAA